MTTTPDPKETPHPEVGPLGYVTCSARNKVGNRCGKRPEPGTNVCRLHGGAAPQVRRKAALRLMELVDPAIATLAREMTRADKSADRQRAANSILDRAGIVRQVDHDTETAKALLVERLLAMREQANAPAPQPDPDIIPSTVVNEEPHA